LEVEYFQLEAEFFQPEEKEKNMSKISEMGKNMSKPWEKTCQNYEVSFYLL